MAMLNNQRVPKSNDATQRTCGIPLADAGFFCGTVDPGEEKQIGSTAVKMAYRSIEVPYLLVWNMAF